MRSGGMVLGSPVAHSMSPALHQAAYDELGLTGWTYGAQECTPENLLDTLRELEAAGLAGVSLTMPLKQAVIPLLARVERLAADVDAVNTVLFGGVDGDWWGANTDVPGLVWALAEAGVTSVASRPVPVIIGAGATAASTVAALAELGARDVTVIARSPERASRLRLVGADFGVSVDVRAWADADLAGAGLVVSTAPAGATDELATTVDRPTGLLVDVVYAPWPTQLAQVWAAGGGAVCGGLEVLVGQAVEQVQLMAGRRPSARRLRDTGLAVLGDRSDRSIG